MAHCAGCAREALFAAVSAPGGRAETQGRTTPCNSATRKMPGNGAPHTKHRQLQSEGRQGFVKKTAKSELTCCQHRNFNQSLPTLYILNLVKRVIRVSVETVKIVGGLPLIQ
ncbi:hypothetical protein [Xanthomonas oryzae]|uniref:hypothetical protein n=2 Tax=Xanthomonas oryzae TaxID=347 RepID=UPI00117F29D7|nr:hypothetical protein [Xanthomonas oryzae]